MGDGFWVKIVAKRVSPDRGRPHGVSYTLSLHAPDDTRLLAYDNSHAVRSGSGPGGRPKPPFDHRHRRTRTVPYSYSDAATLMQDFWEDVNRILAEETVSTWRPKSGY